MISGRNTQVLRVLHTLVPPPQCPPPPPLLFFQGLRLLDPSGVVLEQVCDPVRVYLRTREDTQRCIVASLTDEYSNELADVREGRRQCSGWD